MKPHPTSPGALPVSKGDIARARQAAGLWRAHFPPTLLYPTESLTPIQPQRPLT